MLALLVIEERSLGSKAKSWREVGSKIENTAAKDLNVVILSRTEKVKLLLYPRSARENGMQAPATNLTVVHKGKVALD